MTPPLCPQCKSLYKTPCCDALAETKAQRREQGKDYASDVEALLARIDALRDAAGDVLLWAHSHEADQDAQNALRKLGEIVSREELLLNRTDE